MFFSLPISAAKTHHHAVDFNIFEGSVLHPRSMIISHYYYIIAIHFTP